MNFSIFVNAISILIYMLNYNSSKANAIRRSDYVSADIYGYRICNAEASYETGKIFENDGKDNSVVLSVSITGENFTLCSLSRIRRGR
jgi:ribosomal protein L25 (general stress protein Ctc)